VSVKITEWHHHDSGPRCARQVKNAQGQWIDAEPIEGAFVCNIGAAPASGFPFLVIVLAKLFVSIVAPDPKRIVAGWAVHRDAMTVSTLSWRRRHAAGHERRAVPADAAPSNQCRRHKDPHLHSILL